MRQGKISPVNDPEHGHARWTYLMDMDGVLVHEDHLVPGADEFLAELRAAGTPFVVLTNNSIRTPRDLRARVAQHRAGRAGGVHLDLGAGHSQLPA